MALDILFISDVEHAIAGNLIAILRTAAQHRTPDEAFCMGALVTARANVITMGGKWEQVAQQVRTTLEGEDLLCQLCKSPLLQG